MAAIKDNADTKTIERADIDRIGGCGDRVLAGRGNTHPQCGHGDDEPETSAHDAGGDFEKATSIWIVRHLLQP